MIGPPDHAGLATGFHVSIGLAHTIGDLGFRKDRGYLSDVIL